MGNEESHYSHMPNEGDVFKQESQFGEEIPNQWSFRLKKVETIFIPKNIEDRTNAVDIKRGLILKKDGAASITFDVSSLCKYSISIINESEYAVSFHIEYSPDNHHFYKKKFGKVIDSGQMAFLSVKEYVKFVKVTIAGKQVASIIVYLQGIKR